MNKPKYETCRFAERTGQVAVYVTPGCPMANMIRGVLVSTKSRCEKCENWKRRSDDGRCNGIHRMQMQ